jgi:hypothetical protein
MTRWIAMLLALVVAWPALAQERMLDDFETAEGWTAFTPEGIALEVSTDEGLEGNALRLDFDFNGRGGYAIARKTFDLDLPANYRFRWSIRAEGPGGGLAPVNDLEFKLVDESGANVWWHNRRRLAYPPDWRRLTSKKRHIDFAWGPLGGGDMEEVRAIEFVVTAGEGGRGTVWIDNFTFEELPPDAPYTGTPTATATAGDPAGLFDADSTAGWTAPAGVQTLTVDFGEEREFGGFLLEWGEGRPASDYVIELSDDGETWTRVFEAHGNRGGRDYVPTPEAGARYIRFRFEQSAGDGYDLRHLDVLPITVTASANDFFFEIARREPPGRYPRYFDREQAFWTVVGVDGDESEALVGEDGRVEVDKARFSIEPFLWADGELLGWHEADSTTQSLVSGVLPIPSVTRHHGDFALTTTAYATGEVGRSSLIVSYRVDNRAALGGANRANAADSVRLFLALRPFQVNPPWQFLSTVGGVAPTHSIQIRDKAVVVDDKRLVSTREFDAAGAVPFAAGEVIEWIEAGEVPPWESVEDPARYASAALAYDLAIGQELLLYVPFHEAPHRPRFARDLVEREWSRKLNRVQFTLPPEAGDLAETIRSTLAYIFVNRDGAAIQPGSRSYDRSWIRDGALTSSALLRLGHPEAAQAFAEWYAPFQYENGMVPCCVGAAGADPVPENDSHGQLIFLAAEVYRYTGDTDFLRTMWPHVEAAVAYMDALRAQRMTPAYESDTLQAYFGLLPESISHEGYSAAPMHSYWDQLFGLRGYKDAVFIAEALGEAEAATRFAASRDAFAGDLAASYRRAMQMRGIDYLPGSVELGDFDPTSVSIALDPVDARDIFPDGTLEATYDQWWAFFERRRDGAEDWDAYTPYEWRNVGALVRLGEKERALEALQWFFDHRRPTAWNHWAEVVWRDPDESEFIGDMPHTWVGSDFIRAVTDLFAYEEGNQLIVGAGIPERWAQSETGVGVQRLGTHYGPLTYTLSGDGMAATFAIEAGPTVPPGGIVVRSPFENVQAATIDGEVAGVSGDAVVVRALPSRVVFRR